MPIFAAAEDAQDHLRLLVEYQSVVYVGLPRSISSMDRPIKYENKLRINDSVTYRTATIADEQTGIEDLKDLCQNALKEEYWVFIPDQNLWLETGLCEKTESVEIDLPFFEDLIRKNDNVSVYHIHLKRYLESLEEKGLGKTPESWLIVPSFEDVALMIYFSSMFYKEHPEGNISWFICSPLGRTEYSMTEKGVEYYSKIKGNVFLLSYLYPSSTEPINSNRPLSFNLSTPHSIRDLIVWTDARGKGYFDISFSLEQSRYASSQIFQLY